MSQRKERYAIEQLNLQSDTTSQSGRTNRQWTTHNLENYDPFHKMNPIRIQIKTSRSKSIQQKQLTTPCQGNQTILTQKYQRLKISNINDFETNMINSIVLPNIEQETINLTQRGQKKIQNFTQFQPVDLLKNKQQKLRRLINQSYMNHVNKIVTIKPNLIKLLEV